MFCGCFCIESTKFKFLDYSAFNSFIIPQFVEEGILSTDFWMRVFYPWKVQLEICKSHLSKMTRMGMFPYF